jgi:5'-nucleotidase/UDP-sugar diphosphatase
LILVYRNAKIDTVRARGSCRDLWKAVMSLSNWKLVLLAAVIGALILLSGQALRPSGRRFPLTVLHTNDVHTHYEPFQPWNEPVQGGVARVRSAIDEIRGQEKNVLLLDAGDQFQGTLYFHVGGAQVVSDVMNALEYDAMCIGNHEFDAGPAGLSELIYEADFPALSANIDSSGDPALAGRIAPYEVFSFGNEQIAVFGLTTEQASEISRSGPDVRFCDPVTTAQALVNELEVIGINKVIALTHLGYAQDLLLAAAVSGIDVIVGGHSHTLLGEMEGAAGPYPHTVLSASGEPVVVVTAHEWGRLVGRVDVVFDERGVVMRAVGAPIFIGESIQEDSEVVELLSGYASAIDELKAEVVGETSVPLDGERDRVRTQETNLGNLICDAMLWRTKPLGAQISIQNGGGIRASVPPGEITMGQVLEVLPFGNQISVLELSGEQLLAALENGVRQVEEAAGQFPHVGGLRYTFDANAEAGARIAQVEIWDEAAKQHAPLDIGATYTVAVNTFLADGGDGYTVFEDVGDRYDTGLLMSDVEAEYLRAVSPLASGLEGRIEAVGPADGPAT